MELIDETPEQAVDKIKERFEMLFSEKKLPSEAERKYASDDCECSNEMVKKFLTQYEKLCEREAILRLGKRVQTSLDSAIFATLEVERQKYIESHFFEKFQDVTSLDSYMTMVRKLGESGFPSLLLPSDEKQKDTCTRPSSPKRTVFYDEMIFGSMDEYTEKLEKQFESTIEILEPKPNRESRRHNEKWQKSRYQRRKNNEKKNPLL